MSDTALYLSLSFVGLCMACTLVFIIIAKRRVKQNAGKYKWQPEQDYDVEIRGESAMSPGFPTLVKRKDTKEK